MITIVLQVPFPPPLRLLRGHSFTSQHVSDNAKLREDATPAQQKSLEMGPESGLGATKSAEALGLWACRGVVHTESLRILSSGKLRSSEY